MTDLDEAERELSGPFGNTPNALRGAIHCIIAHLRASQPATESGDPKRDEAAGARVPVPVGRVACTRCGGLGRAGGEWPCSTCSGMGHVYPPEAPPVEGVSDEELMAVVREQARADLSSRAPCLPPYPCTPSERRALYDFGASRSSAAKDARIAELQILYSELLYQVGSVYPGETRHQTALRYLQKAEQGNGGCGQAPKAEEPTP